MTLDERTAAVIRKLTDRTRAGRVEWSGCRSRFAAADGRADAYVTSFPGGTRGGMSTELTWRIEYYSPPAAPDLVQLEVLRQVSVDEDRWETEILFTAEAEDGGDQEQFDLLMSLFEAARRTATGWDEALERMEAVLDAA